mmetsp:Transcript_34224/g.82402  ORF Transcript_34224/g.82402 Transcript_34224/m.82402 type:complete len:116 (+) Transcript_34224:510-857(+)
MSMKIYVVLPVCPRSFVKSILFMYYCCCYYLRNTPNNSFIFHVHGSSQPISIHFNTKKKKIRKWIYVRNEKEEEQIKNTVEFLRNRSYDRKDPDETRTRCILWCEKEHTKYKDTF